MQLKRFFRRVIGAARLDAATYEEVEHDRSATLPAGLVVVVSAAAAGLGAIHNHGLAGILWHTVAAFVGWHLWAFTTLLIGTRLLPHTDTEADHGQLLRTIGFSSAPGILRVVGIVEPLAGPVFLLTGAWMLVAMVVAVRQALDYRAPGGARGGTGRAIAVCALGFPIYAVVLMSSLLLLGPWPV